MLRMTCQRKKRQQQKRQPKRTHEIQNTYHIIGTYTNTKVSIDNLFEREHEADYRTMFVQTLLFRGVHIHIKN